MDTSKIVQLRENVRTWTPPDGETMYVHNVQLENGVQGFAFGKSPKAPYQNGDSVLYEQVSQTPDGTRLRIKKDTGYQQQRGGGQYQQRRNDPGKELRIMRQSALKIAANMLGAGKPLQDYVNTAEACIKYFQGGQEQQHQGAPHPAVETRTPAPQYGQPQGTQDTFPY